MRVVPSSRMRRHLLIASAIAALAIGAYLAAQSGEFFVNGRIVPFADPTDNPNNDAVIVTHVSLMPGQITRWHKHTGDVYLVVQMGTITEDLGCGRTMDFPAGTADHTPVNVVHRIINNGDTVAWGAVFQIHPHGLPPSRPASEPEACGP